MRYYLLIVLFIFVSSLFSIQVSGNVYGTWTVADSPYQLMGDVTIPVDSVLHINPGVVIQAMGYYQFNVNGHLLALGNIADSIRFVSGQIDPNALWKGIRFDAPTNNSLMNNCQVEKADYGANVINTSVNFQWCRFNQNKKGIQSFAIGEENPAYCSIFRCLIESSREEGILIVQNSHTTVGFCELRYNGTASQYRGAIQLSNQSAGGSNSPEIHHNYIHHNLWQGIIAWDIVSANAINPSVHHNDIEHNLSGIYFRHASGSIYQNEIHHNFISGNANSGAGLMISGNTAMPFVAENNITGNYTGFYLTENANPVLGNPLINHPWAHGGNTIEQNIDGNNVEHSVVLAQYTNSALQVFAQQNEWGHDTADEIAATITDHNDNAALGTVIYEPWGIPDQPARLSGSVETSLNPDNIINPRLQIISRDTGEILEEYPVTLFQQFDISTAVDTIVYIFVTATDANTNQPLYGAYSSCMLPFVQGINLNVNEEYELGILSLYYAEYPWSNRMVGEPAAINGHQAFPIRTGFMMYAPDKADWVYQDGEYLRIIQKQFGLQTPNPVTLPINDLIWYKQPPYQDGQSWQQVWDISPGGAVTMAQAHVYANIWDTTNPNQLRYFDLIEYLDADGNGLGSDRIYRSGGIAHYRYEQNCLSGWSTEDSGSANDSLMYALLPGNRWYVEEVYYPGLYYSNVFDLFHTRGDSLTFYWQPPSADGHVYDHYRFKIDNAGYQDFPLTQRHITIPLPTNDAPHSYRVCTLENGVEYAHSPYLWFAILPTEDEIMPPSKLSIYPNPFNALQTAGLTIKYDGALSAKTQLQVYNLKGQLVRSLKLTPAAKQTQVHWDGKDSIGKACASGLYQIRLTDSKGKKICKKVMLIH